MSLADSIRQTASIARWVSEAVTVSDQIIPTQPPQGQGRAVVLEQRAFRQRIAEVAPLVSD
jgi:hypothetical protein